ERDFTNATSGPALPAGMLKAIVLLRMPMLSKGLLSTVSGAERPSLAHLVRRVMPAGVVGSFKCLQAACWLRERLLRYVR
ncbi:MAG: hypothetical protein ACPIE8_07955, partial [Henriciella sp.]